MANIIIKTQATRHRNACMEAKERAMCTPKNYNTTSTLGDLKIQEGSTAKGNKMIVITDKQEGIDKQAKESYIRSIYGDNPTANGHGTVVTVGDEHKMTKKKE